MTANVTHHEFWPPFRKYKPQFWVKPSVFPAQHSLSKIMFKFILLISLACLLSHTSGISLMDTFVKICNSEWPIPDDKWFEALTCLKDYFENQGLTEKEATMWMSELEKAPGNPGYYPGYYENLSRGMLQCCNSSTRWDARGVFMNTINKIPQKKMIFYLQERQDRILL